MKSAFKKILLVVALGTVLAFQAPPAQAATSCSSVASAVSSLITSWETQLTMWAYCAAFAPETVGTSLAVCGAADAAVIAVVVWNAVAGNSWATLGPRSLGFEQSSGKVIGTAGRVFITSQTFPKGFGIRLKKTGNKGKVGVAVCVIDTDGNVHHVADWTIDPGSDNTGVEYHYVYPGGFGDYVFIGLHIDGKSATKSFAYDVQLIDWGCESPQEGFPSTCIPD